MRIIDLDSRRKKPKKVAIILQKDERIPRPKKNGARSNPNGRPCKGESWAEVVREVMNENHIDGRRSKEKIIRNVAKLAEAGVEWAVNFVANREDGRPKTYNEIIIPGSRGPDLSKVPSGTLEALIQQIVKD